MEVELVTQGFSEDENYTIDDSIEDYSDFEGERCGICMDIIIDRGVIDCCQHWFCFTCIDNWATITNLCPLCQNEFQLITCVPVYDTIGSNKTDEDSNPRDCDWSIDGKINILSSPSYYIDENAVVCLDGDGCKIRNGSSAVEEDSNLDTSIACDSCDKWYHALCVGFDTESTCEDSWLCPRCLTKETAEISEGILEPGPSKEHHQDNAGDDCLVGRELVGKVSISVADVGETAVVISMIEGDQESTRHSPRLDLGEDLKDDAPISNSNANLPKVEKLPCNGSADESNLGTQGLELSLSRNTFLPSSSHSIEITDMVTNTEEKMSGELRLLDGLKNCSRELSAAPSNTKLLEAGLDLHLALSVNSSSAVDLTRNESDTHKVSGHLQLLNGSRDHLLPAIKEIIDERETLSTMPMQSNERDNGVSTAKRKHNDSRDTCVGEKKNGAKFCGKKSKSEGRSQHSYSKDNAYESESGGSDSKGRIISSSSQKENTTNRMDIVPETNSLTELTCADPADVSPKEKENASGLRVKKIIRRASNDKDTSLVVQTLRKEIREAVRNKSSNELGESHFDPKLLDAFRAVVAGRTTETRKIPVDLKAKKLLLQKGKIRENLTKKIYGVGGKRRRSWTRDCDIEFWKYRCTKASKPEKVQTLKSVLDHLRDDSDDKTIEHGKEVGTKNNFLSRLYLADTSVFPRKGDIKPVLVHESPAVLDSKKEHRSTEKSAAPSNPSSTNLQKNEILAQGVDSLLDTKVTPKSTPELKHEVSSSKISENKCPKGPPLSSMGASKATSQKELVGTSHSKRSDKRKWALELLARKTAVIGKKAAHEKDEDSVLLKGNFPLLAQLPKDMRPELAPSRHNKVPAAVRQPHLYRLAEHFLKKANIQVIRRTAETELAIADAINIEKEIADRSNSKLVYVNLCSQEIRRKADTTSTKAVELDPTSAPEVVSGKAETNSDHCDDLVGDDALRAAGLLSDTPPGSPLKAMEDIKEDACLSEKIEDDGPDNIFEVESHPDLDIYGDFEYSLEDDDLFGACAPKISKPQIEDSKIKVVLATINKSQKLDNPVGDLEQENASRVEVLEDSLLPNQASLGSSTVDICTDSTCQSSTIDGGEELSLAECEELYGPDKEPLIKKFPEAASMKPYEPSVNDKIHGEKGNHGFTSIINQENGSNEGNLENASDKEKSSKSGVPKSQSCNYVSKKVEAYIKEHIRPLCKSGVITVEQYKWAVGKTTEKVMKFHSRDKNANFLIKEGEKVKKLAEQYVETAQLNIKDP